MMMIDILGLSLHFPLYFMKWIVENRKSACRGRALSSHLILLVDWLSSDEMPSIYITPLPPWLF